MTDTKLETGGPDSWDLGDHWGRVVAVGDIHADLDATLRILQATELIDGSGRWIAPETLLVQVGDLVDRGPDGADLLSYLMEIQQQAEQCGSRVECLIGNHEIAVVDGNFSSISENESASVKRFQYGELEGLHAFYRGQSPYALWLKQRPTIVKSGKSIFMHAGIDSWAIRHSPDWINANVSKWITYLQGGDEEPDFDTQFLVQDQGTGPTWSRRFRYPAEYMPTSARINELVERVLDSWGGIRFVVGHCPTIHYGWKIALDHPVYGDTVVSIDTGICRYYSGSLSALQIKNEQLTAFHFDRGDTELDLTACLRDRYAQQRKDLTVS